MKKISSLKFILLLLVFQGTMCISFSQSWTAQQCWIPSYVQAIQIYQHNGFARRIVEREADFYCNPLVLNGEMLDYNQFALESHGTLSVVTGNPSNVKAEKIPYRIMLRREGKILSTIDVSGKGVYEIEISKILILAKEGDQLVIDPVNPKDWKAKRILKLLSKSKRC